MFSTYVGGSDVDIAQAVGIGAAATVWIAGQTSSTNFPTTGAPYQANAGGGGDAFLTRVNSFGTGLLYSTYLGGPNGDGAFGLAVDAEGSVYVAGNSNPGFPTTPGSFRNASHGGPDGFMAKFREPLTLTSLIPVIGLPVGGGAVVLTGTNFVDGLSVSFGTSSVPGTYVDPTELLALTPPHAPGPVDVAVVAADGSKSNTLVNGFTYLLPDGGFPDLDAGLPDAGGTDGGQLDAGVTDGGVPPGCSCASDGEGLAGVAFAFAVVALAACARPRRSALHARQDQLGE